MSGHFLLLFTINIVSDFLSLFFIRRFLQITGHRPIAAYSLLTFSFLLVLLFNMSFRIIFGVISIDEVVHTVDSGSLTEILNKAIDFDRALILTPNTLFLPALIVFMWLPIFGYSLAIVRTFNALTPMVRKAQWLIKDGENHPLNAVGYVAAAIVFFVTLIWRHVRGEAIAQQAMDYGTQLASAF